MRHALLLCTLIVCAPVAAQDDDLGERLREVGNDYAAAYVAPLVDGLGADLNSGLFQAAHFGRREDGLDVYIGVRAMAMPLGSNDETFSLTYRSRAQIEVDLGPSTAELNLPATYSVEDAPTLFGADEPGIATVRVRHDTTISYLGVLLPVSIDTTYQTETIEGMTEVLSVVPFAVIQGGIGTFFGTSLVVRWLPSIEVEDLGGFGFVGFGIRHSLDRYLPLLPFNLAVQGAWQRARVDDDAGDRAMTATAFAANLEVSRRFGAVTLFGGVQSEETRLRVTYDVEDESAEDGTSFPIDLDLRSANRVRFVVGADVAAGPVHLYADLNLGNRTAFSAGLGLVFRGPAL